MASGWILAYKATDSSNVNYLHEQKKSWAEDDAERAKAQGFEIISIFQAQRECDIITKEGK